MKASIIFFPNTQKKSTRNGKIPLYGRVIINRTKAENRLLAEVPETDLLKWDPITMRFIDRYNLANHILNVFQPIKLSACSDSTFFAVSIGTELYNNYRDSLKNAFEKEYLAKCMHAAEIETFTVTHQSHLYHYTLYYYDQAGNLVKTIPPKAVNPEFDSTWTNSVKAARAANSYLVPSHDTAFATAYRYNTLNQVTSQRTPDAGISRFWYDNLGRLVLSQNAKQAPNDFFSYTLYDALGRITEVGQIENNADMLTELMARNQALDYGDLVDIVVSGYRTQITRTVYDEKYDPLDPLMSAKNLRNRVAWTALYDNSDDLDGNQYTTATFYTYDIHGSVDTLVQDYKQGLMADKDNRFKKIVYRYDLVSGKVNHVAYQPGQPDAFYHKYYYDAENRLTNVETSHDSIHWDNDALYKYYRHGPLARSVIGQQQVQGVDYAYTLQGWLKGVNGSAIAMGSDAGSDMGADGINGSRIARDAYSFSLYYYGNRDYKPVSSADNPFAPVDVGIVRDGEFRRLFNGNISVMTTHIPKLGDHLLYAYNYDQLNRLVGMHVNKDFDNSNNDWNSANSTDDYLENITYDANGNIMTYHRYGNAASGTLDMDYLTYNYYSGTNRLRYIDDGESDTNYPNDIDDQAPDNYQYDEIGNLVSDDAESISEIQWTVYGKIRQIVKNDLKIVYTYDPAGNRISKWVEETGITIWYVRDAQGNVMAVYNAGTPGESEESINAAHLTQTEVHLYGSSRLGIQKPAIDMENVIPPGELVMNLVGIGYVYDFTRGQKYYELSNHLGNVLVTVTDKKTEFDDGTGHVDYYEADIASATDYAPFGMPLVGRTYEAGSYRFGFDGQERSDDIKGEGNSYTAQFWEYDPRIGRRWNLDPVFKDWESQYSCFSNNPLIYIDPNGTNPIDRVKQYAKSHNIADFKLRDDRITGTMTMTWIVVDKDGSTSVNVKKFPATPKELARNAAIEANFGPELPMHPPGTPPVSYIDYYFENGKAQNVTTSSFRQTLYHSLKRIADEVRVDGQLLEKVKNDAGFLVFKRRFMNTDQSPYTDLVCFGGPPLDMDNAKKSIGGFLQEARKALYAAQNELTWVIRNTYVTAQASNSGNHVMGVRYTFSDPFDLKPSKLGKEGVYNWLARKLGRIYHGLLEGSESMRVTGDFTQ